MASRTARRAPPAPAREALDFPALLDAVGDDLRVRCSACHSEGVLKSVPGSSFGQDWARWAAEPCFFASGCPGLVQREELN